MGQKICKSIFSLSTVAVTAFLGMLFGACSNDTVEEQFGACRIIPVVTVNPIVETSAGAVSTGVFAQLPSDAELGLTIQSADGRYSNTWMPLTDFRTDEPFRPGEYVVEAFYGSADAEGFDCPYFYGSRTVNLVAGTTTQVDVECRLANTGIAIKFDSQYTNVLQDISATIHSAGGGYVEYPSNETRTAFVNPGAVSLFLDVTTVAGTHAEFLAATVSNAHAGKLYEISVGCETTQNGDPQLRISFDDRISTDDIVIALTPSFLAAAPPVLTATGFDQQTSVEIIEGNRPAEAVAFGVEGCDGGKLLLTTKARSLVSRGWPDEVDLLNADSDVISRMQALGLKLTETPSGISAVDLTDVLPHLRADDPVDAFFVSAVSAQGKMSGPVALSVDVQEAGLSVISVSDVLMGLNIGQMHIVARGDDVAKNIAVEVKSADGTAWKAAEILAVEPLEGHDGEWIVRFRVPQMAVASTSVRLLYCGDERVSSTIRFVSPEFSIEADPYARYAAVRFSTAEAGMLETVTSMAKLYVNGQKQVLMRRDPENGLILLGGLNEHTQYVITASLYDNPTEQSQFCAPVKIETERCLAVPNGSFEDVHDGVKYKNLPAGGRFSQNIVDIFNCQNYATYDYFAPKQWANTNAKTFCRQAANYNTWYMQPSVYSITDATAGAYAVSIVSTSWDLNGPTIEPYRQTGTPYTSYSMNIPSIAHRAAGKVFLGEYGFDPATGKEVYKEGVSFTSRPTSLNGYYRYMPCIADQSDRGLVIVELVADSDGTDIVVSRGVGYLSVATGYTAFSIPLTYDLFGVKPYKLKIMLSSSSHIGTIAEESASVITFSDPVTSKSLGGSLQIDDLTFSY